LGLRFTGLGRVRGVGPVPRKTKVEDKTHEETEEGRLRGGRGRLGGRGGKEGWKEKGKGGGENKEERGGGTLSEVMAISGEGACGKEGQQKWTPQATLKRTDGKNKALVG